MIYPETFFDLCRLGVSVLPIHTNLEIVSSYITGINFKNLYLLNYNSDSVQIWFLRSLMIYLETFFDLYRLGISIPPCRTKPDFASSQKFRGLYEKSVVMWWWDSQRRWIKSKCNWFVFRKHFPKAKLICLSENLKSSQLPMSQIARTLLILSSFDHNNTEER